MCLDVVRAFVGPGLVGAQTDAAVSLHVVGLLLGALFLVGHRRAAVSLDVLVLGLVQIEALLRHSLPPSGRVRLIYRSCTRRSGLLESSLLIFKSASPTAILRRCRD